MVKSFRFLEDVAIADIAFEAKGKTLEELFANCGKALSEIMVDTKKIIPKKVFEFEKEGQNIESLLYDFLSELVYLKDVDGLVFKEFKVNLEKKQKVRVVCKGNFLSSLPKNSFRNDVKAITLHLFGIKKEGRIFLARVVVDI
ncbi:MAG: archease [Candidatus Diapherotrites archaeon]